MASEIREWSVPAPARALLWWPAISFVLVVVAPDAATGVIIVAGAVLALRRRGAARAGPAAAAARGRARDHGVPDDGDAARQRGPRRLSRASRTVERPIVGCHTKSYDGSARACAPRPLRQRGEPLRRPRRGDQHHAADPAAPGRRGGAPRPQPLGRRGGRGRDPGGRAGHRDQLVPGRARRVLHLPRRAAARARRRAHPGLRRRRRRDRAARDRAAARARRRARSSPPRTASASAYPG